MPKIQREIIVSFFWLLSFLILTGKPDHKRENDLPLPGSAAVISIISAQLIVLRLQSRAGDVTADRMEDEAPNVPFLI